MESVFHTNGTQRSLPSKSWFQEITAGGYRALILDCDGTLVESSEVHLTSFQAAVRAQGQDMQRDWYFARTGLDRRSLFTAFSAEISNGFDVERAIKNSIQNFIELSPAVTSIDETAELVQALEKTHPMAVATNAELEVATASLSATNLLGYFGFIASISDNVAAKPAPDIYVLAAERLGFQTNDTLVFEDSKEGVRAALDAGLDVIQIIHD
ncbi:HAD family hydrolase [Aliiroseovarius sp. 2305UL8-7]|uniref:HAD family hydrolase n=1 Tax=Aliiroseovarius conchicola TaxID=3121637 RepID=UPI003529957B